MLLQEKPEERYDTLIGILLSLAMLAGVWFYALKPWVKHGAVIPANEEVASVAETKACDVPAAPAKIITKRITTVPVEPSTTIATTVIPPTVPTASFVEHHVDKAIAAKPAHAMMKTIKRIALPVKPVTKPAPVIKAIVPPAVVPAPPVVAPIVVEPPKPVAKVEPLPIPPAEPVKVEPVAKPAPVIEPVAPGVVVRESFEFSTASARLPPSALPRLQEITQLLKNDSRSLKIVGHTDNIGDARANHILSLKRAKAVRRYLVNAGIPWTQLTVEGAGADNPIADNATEEGRTRNRRIEITE